MDMNKKSLKKKNYNEFEINTDTKIWGIEL
jgi:hypothetical protein